MSVQYPICGNCRFFTKRDERNKCSLSNANTYSFNYACNDFKRGKVR